MKKCLLLNEYIDDTVYSTCTCNIISYKILFLLLKKVSTLREALDTVTREKNLLRHQLTSHTKAQPSHNVSNHNSSSLTSEEDFGMRLQFSQLRDTLYQVERERDALRDRLGSMESQRQESMEQYQQEVESSMLEVTNQVREREGMDAGLLHSA